VRQTYLVLCVREMSFLFSSICSCIAATLPASTTGALFRQIVGRQVAAGQIKLILAANVEKSDFSSEQAEPQRASRSVMVKPRGINSPAKVKVKVIQTHRQGFRPVLYFRSTNAT